MASHNKGLIDPASLITLGVLVVTLVGSMVATKVVQRSSENRSQALVTDGGGGGVYKPPTSVPAKPTSPPPTNKPPDPTPVPRCNGSCVSASTPCYGYGSGSCNSANLVCCLVLNPSPLPTSVPTNTPVPQPTKLPSPTPTPSCKGPCMPSACMSGYTVDTGTCIAGLVCCKAIVYPTNTPRPTLTQAPTTKPTEVPSPTPSCPGVCMPNCYIPGFTQGVGVCSSGLSCCKELVEVYPTPTPRSLGEVGPTLPPCNPLHPSDCYAPPPTSTPKPTPTPTSIIPSECETKCRGLDGSLYTSCVSLCKYPPSPTPSPTPKPSLLDTVSQGIKDLGEEADFCSNLCLGGGKTEAECKELCYNSYAAGLSNVTGNNTVSSYDIQGSRACAKDPTSVECQQYNTYATLRVAAGAALTAPVTVPLLSEAATAAYISSEIALATSPTLQAVTASLPYFGLSADFLTIYVAKDQCDQGNQQACQTFTDAMMGNAAGFNVAAINSAPITAQEGSLLNRLNIDSAQLRDRALESAAKQIWGDKINITASYIDRELTKNGDVITTVEEWNAYELIKKQVDELVAQGKQPANAVNQVLAAAYDKKQALGEKATLISSFKIVSNPTTASDAINASIAHKLYFGDVNCVQFALCGQKLLNEFDIPSNIIFGTGGGSPYIHSALETPFGIIPFGGDVKGRLFNQTQFSKYNQTVQNGQWGKYYFNLPK